MLGNSLTKSKNTTQLSLRNRVKRGCGNLYLSNCGLNNHHCGVIFFLYKKYNEKIILSEAKSSRTRLNGSFAMTTFHRNKFFWSLL